MTLDPASLGSALAALLGVIGLILLASRLARRAGLGAAGPSGRRLALVETLAIDQRRRLVIARCDGRELLLLLGGERDLLLGTPAGQAEGAAS